MCLSWELLRCLKFAYFQVDQVSQVERMRQAVLEGLELSYAPPIVIPMPNRPPVPPLFHPGQSRPGPVPIDLAHRLAPSTVRGRGMIGMCYGYCKGFGRYPMGIGFGVLLRDVILRGHTWARVSRVRAILEDQAESDEGLEKSPYTEILCKGVGCIQ